LDVFGLREGWPAPQFDASASTYVFLELVYTRLGLVFLRIEQHFYLTPCWPDTS
jgi:hypothetical protein